MELMHRSYASFAQRCLASGLPSVVPAVNLDSHVALPNDSPPEWRRPRAALVREAGACLMCSSVVGSWRSVASGLRAWSQNRDTVWSSLSHFPVAHIPLLGFAALFRAPSAHASRTSASLLPPSRCGPSRVLSHMALVGSALVLAAQVSRAATSTTPQGQRAHGARLLPRRDRRVRVPLPRRGRAPPSPSWRPSLGALSPACPRRRRSRGRDPHAKEELPSG